MLGGHQSVEVVVFIVIVQLKSSALFISIRSLAQISTLPRIYPTLALHKERENIQLVQPFKIYSRTSVVA